MKKIYSAIILMATLLSAASCANKELGIYTAPEPPEEPPVVPPTPEYPQNLKTVIDYEPLWQSIEDIGERTRAASLEADRDHFPLGGEKLNFMVFTPDDKLVAEYAQDPYVDDKDGDLYVWQTHTFPADETNFKGDYKVIISSYLTTKDGHLCRTEDSLVPEEMTGPITLSVTMYRSTYTFDVPLADIPLLDIHKNMKFMTNDRCSFPYAAEDCTIPSTQEENQTFEVVAPLKDSPLYSFYTNIPNIADRELPSNLFCMNWGVVAGLSNDITLPSFEMTEPVLIPRYGMNALFINFTGHKDKVYYYYFSDFVRYDREDSKIIFRVWKAYDITDQIDVVMTGETSEISFNAFNFSNEDVKAVCDTNGWASIYEATGLTVINKN